MAPNVTRTSGERVSGEQEHYLAAAKAPNRGAALAGTRSVINQSLKRSPMAITSSPGTPSPLSPVASPRLRSTILVSTHDPALGAAVERVLTRNGFLVRAAGNGQATLELFAAVDPDLVVLEANLAEGSGLDVCRAIRTRSAVPVLFVSARASEIDIVVALEVGADDFLARPQRLQELVARVRMLLRRVPQRTEPVRLPLEVGDLRLDVERHEVSVAGRPLALPRKEFHLLRVLMERPGALIPRGLLIERVWGADYVGDTKTLDVHVRRLRAKIEADRAEPRLIVTVRGLGFKLEVGDQTRNPVRSESPTELDTL